MQSAVQNSKMNTVQSNKSYDSEFGKALLHSKVMLIAQEYFTLEQLALCNIPAGLWLVAVYVKLSIHQAKQRPQVPVLFNP